MIYPIDMPANNAPTWTVETRPDPAALRAAAKEVLAACFMSPRQCRRNTWAYKSFRSIPMDMSPRQRAAVRQLAAFFEEIK